MVVRALRTLALGAVSRKGRRKQGLAVADLATHLHRPDRVDGELGRIRRRAVLAEQGRVSPGREEPQELLTGASDARHACHPEARRHDAVYDLANGDTTAPEKAADGCDEVG